MTPGSIYKSLFPYETRMQIYKMRNRQAYRDLRQAEYPSAKGDFSLAPFDKHRCIFVHITKSAGTSVALSLFGKLPYHYTAIDYRVIFGRRDFEHYFKFGFVRNPWDRLYSAYTYLQGGGWDKDDVEWRDNHLKHIASFEDFILHWLDKDKLNSHMHFWPQHRFIYDSKDRLLLDYVGRFETLAKDFDFIANHLKLDASLSATNASSRKNDYRDVYSDSSRAKVAELYAKDIELLGYSFDGFNDQLSSVSNQLSRNHL